ncbi:MAG: ribosome maturation factor RimM [Bacteroidales bacterium]|nr:ribosome maturation factor RimM [Bacteroidales bacterium]
MKNLPPISDCVSIGTITQTFGNKGELIFVLSPCFSIQLSDFSHFFIERDGMLVPFYYSISSQKKQKYIIEIEGVDTVLRASEFLNAEVYLPNNMVSVDAESESQNYIGFSVFDHAQLVGVVDSVQNYFMHTVLSVFMHENEREVLIPFTPDFIENIDLEGKHIYMNLPEGLLNL